MLWLKEEIGFTNWRFDFVKGYGANFITQYCGDTVGNELFNVGEYWADLRHASSVLTSWLVTLRQRKHGLQLAWFTQRHLPGLPWQAVRPQREGSACACEAPPQLCDQAAVLATLTLSAGRCKLSAQTDRPASGAVQAAYPKLTSSPACSYGDGLEHNQNGPRQVLCDWLDKAGGCTLFDFPTKGILAEAVANTQYWRLRDQEGKPPGLLGWWPSRAVTFVDNHDTGARVSAESAGVTSCCAGNCETRRASHLACWAGGPLVLSPSWTTTTRVRSSRRKLRKCRCKCKCVAVYTCMATTGIVPVCPAGRSCMLSIAST